MRLPRFHSARRRWAAIGLSALGGALAVAPAVRAADQVSVQLLGVDFDIPISALEDVATTGQFQGSLSSFNSLLKPEGLSRLKEALTAQAPISQKAIANVFQSAQTTPGVFLNQLGLIIRSGSANRNGAEDIRQAVLKANASPSGLTLLSFFKAYNDSTVLVDLSNLQQVGAQAKILKEQTQLISSLITQAAAQSVTPPPLNLPAVTQPGPQSWVMTSYDWKDTPRNRQVPTDLYLPTTKSKGPLPLVLISHGLGENRQSLAYVARHLASYGFAVAVPLHIGTSEEGFKNVLEGYAKPPNAQEAINRPKDLSFVLDQLSADPKLSTQVNTQKVVALGHSYGGYTVLANGGAPLSPAYARQNCQSRDQLNLNLSIALQCTFVTLPQDQYNLRDPRVVGVVAANAFTSASFSPEALQQVQVPTVMLASSADLIVPMVKEATPAYAKFPGPDKYFVQFKRGTHFSVLPPSDGDAGVIPVPADLIGPPQTIGNTYFKAIALTFAQAYLQQDTQAKQRLSQAGLGQLSDPQMPLAILRGPLP